MRHVLCVLAASFVLVMGCEAPPEDVPADTPAEHAELAATQEPDVLDQYWENLSAHCGEAFPGQLAVEPPGDEMLEGEELLVVHFDVCTEDEIRLPFHIEQMDGEWDRSRTWIFRRTEDGRIELRHDHRQSDGTMDEVPPPAWGYEDGGGPLR